ncbi:amino acid adenylation domain-containing protein [Bacillus horti]|uniref:Amino acid adenylation domain-containing protein/non-ribosomal peptide synthase protein (TIGR01720 family) n=1 Tax=Caldalkalibacillus horti TaxID=77523 RepID=A0ABT9W3H5_9BACI|nr:amino acid adenylation domain-containing protein [Bacillus horti]MDQ0167627.1 amino acid adenylation domain-containing protein/non-ribosomal peptide synthase protein (TIGR01720 family) [Bacillus horti]
MNTELQTNLMNLTHAQKRIWYIEKISPLTPIHNISAIVTIGGMVNYTSLSKAINHFVKHNAGIRYRFIERDSHVYQYEEEFKEFTLDFFDFTNTEKPDEALLKWSEQENAKAFSLKHESLYYFAIFKLSDEQSGFFYKIHHIISDGGSFPLLVDQIYNAYEAIQNDSELDKRLSYSYSEYIEQETEYMKSKRFIRDKEYWHEQFNRDPEFIVKTSPSLEGRKKVFFLDKVVSKRIKQWVAENDCSLNSFFTGIFLIFLSKFYQQSDLIIGTPVSNHTMKNKHIFGMMTSTMPLRVNCEDQEILQFMKLVERQLKRSYKHQRYPYDLLVNELELKRKGIDQLIAFSVNYYNFHLNHPLDGMKTRTEEQYSGYQIYSLQWVVNDWTEELQLDYQYKVEDYTEQDIDHIHHYLKTLILYSLDSPKLQLNEISLLDPSLWHEMIYSFNQTTELYPDHLTMTQLFERQAELTPNHNACVFEGLNLTYEQLNGRANQLARLLRKQGVVRNQFVGVMLDHSFDLIIGILAIMKAGGAYIPIDSSYPKERIKYILEHSKCTLVLVDQDIGEEQFACSVINISNEKTYNNEQNNNLDLINRPSDLVYMIYTSGSTGKPKGVMIKHQSLVNYCWWAKKSYIHHADDTFALYSSIAFDLTVTSIFTPLICGNRIAIYRTMDEPFVLQRVLEEKVANIIKLTPAHLSLLKDRDYQDSGVTVFIVGGDNLKVQLCKEIVQAFGEDITIFNEYGPTEATVGCMIYKYDADKDIGISVPIGRPADNVACYVLDQHMLPAPYGSIGELYLSGDGLAEGYLHHEELTNQKFIPNPFIQGSKMYRTGDLVTLQKDGCYSYEGRMDHQVKIRGYRIELAEIESCLQELPAIKEAIVLLHENGVDSPFLCAYILCDANQSISESYMKDQLYLRLPEYMVPNHYVQIEKIPLTSNGKIDQSMLPKPSRSLDSQLVAAKDTVEQILLTASKKVLMTEALGMNHNFYHAGGDSIKAIQLSSQLHDIGYELKVKDILSTPILKDLARRVNQRVKETSNTQSYRGDINPLPITEWFFEQGFSNQNYYHQSFLLKLKKAFSLQQVQSWLSDLLQQHDALRMNYSSERKKLFYNSDYMNHELELQEVVLHGLTKEDQIKVIKQTGTTLKASMDIEKGLLFSGCLFRISEKEDLLLLTAHHLIIDGVSWRILLNDLDRLMGQSRQETRSYLLEKTSSYQLWAQRLHEYSANDLLPSLAYWEKSANHSFRFPKDNRNGSRKLAYAKKLSVQLGEEQTTLLLSKANLSYQTSTHELIVTSLALALSNFTKQKSLCFLLEGHGREELFDDVDVSRTVGWFTTIYPIALYVEDLNVATQIKKQKEELRRVPNKGLDYGVIRYLKKQLQGCFEKELVRLNYLGDLDHSFKSEYIDYCDIETGEEYSLDNELTCLLDINAWVIRKKLTIEISYSQQEFMEATIQSFITEFKQQLGRVIHHCSSREQTEYTPSDFDTISISQEDLDQLFEV